MPYQISWVVPQRVLLVKVSGQLTEEDIRQGSATGRKLMDRGIAPVHGIVDISSLEQLGVPVFQTITLNSALRHPKKGWAVICGNRSDLVQSVLPIAGKYFNLRYHLAKDLPAALAFLKTVDDTLAGGP